MMMMSSAEGGVPEPVSGELGGGGEFHVVGAGGLAVAVQQAEPVASHDVGGGEGALHPSAVSTARCRHGPG
jgi:hypothetical protein